MEEQTCCIPVGAAAIQLTSAMPPVPISDRRAELEGIWGLDLGLTDPEARLAAWEKAGFAARKFAGGFSADLSGVRVFAGPDSAPYGRPPGFQGHAQRRNNPPRAIGNRRGESLDAW